MINYITLTELSERIQSVINSNFAYKTFSVLAEVSKVSTDKNNNYYLDLIDTDNAGSITSKIKGFIWRSDSKRILDSLKSANINLKEGIKTIFTVQVSFHKQYGLGIRIDKIDIAYIKGVLELKKDEIRTKLRNEKLFSNNKSSTLPILIKNIAIIGAKDSSGLKDFYKTLESLCPQCNFNVNLFESFVQGANARNGILKNLNYITSNYDKYDVIVLLRGGGAASDLDVFNDYEIARNICLSPLPVLIGIGHSTDTTILDEVCFYSAITPTELATYITKNAESVIIQLNNLKQNIFKAFNNYLNTKKDNIKIISRDISGLKIRLKEISHKIELMKLSIFNNTSNLLKEYNANWNRTVDKILNVQNVLYSRNNSLLNLTNTIKFLSGNRIRNFENKLNTHLTSISINSKNFIGKQNTDLKTKLFGINNQYLSVLRMFKEKIKHLSEKIDILDPLKILNRGYTITYVDGTILKSIKCIKLNDEIKTLLSDGLTISKITKINKN
jgi:exodeoxyribonuclease VII large subunit